MQLRPGFCVRPWASCFLLGQEGRNLKLPHSNAELPNGNVELPITACSGDMGPMAIP